LGALCLSFNAIHLDHLLKYEFGAIIYKFGVCCLEFV
jgi:hypothetical protein